MAVGSTLGQIEPTSFGGAADFAEVNEWVSEEGRDYVAINGLESFDPFFLSLVTTGEQWFFCSSHGSLSAGRNSAESALFPYLTVDKIHGNWNVTGPVTAVQCDGVLWHPFWPTSTHAMPVSRRLLKSVLGEELIFEEVHEELKLRFRYHWQASEKFGFVRKAKIINEGGENRSIRLIDGLQDIQVAGVGSRVHLELSCLADAYRMSELACDGRLMIHRLASGIVDAPIPLESLKATTVWSSGFEEGQPYLSRRDAERFLKTGVVSKAVDRSRGERGAYLLGGEISLSPGSSQEWTMVAEIEQSHEEVGRLAVQLREPAKLLAEVEQDLAEARTRLSDLAESVDGLQQTGDRDAALYHYHNTLCNFLRGGLPESGPILSRDQFIHFLTENNSELVSAQRNWLEALPESIERRELLEKAEEMGDPDLLRLAVEYLPLILGRRHGDPSRPWNKFNIRLTDEQGRPVHHYEGNWRDIFQNWEALAWSYPAYLDGFIHRFLNASTIDGFNPYRVTSSGVDWEVPDKDDPWVSIGYWGDHQIIYLLKFLELKEKIDPQALRKDLGDRRFVFADVPYVLDSWEEMLEDPRHTVEFDQARHEHLMSLKREMGGDGLLLRNDSGTLVKASLMEKLLIPALAKLGQMIPDGGIWMSNQKPEWNDANNALAGTGLSVVTSAYLLRYFKFLARLIEGAEETSYPVSLALLSLVERLREGLQDSRWGAEAPRSDQDRFELAKANGKAIELYREEVTGSGGREVVELSNEHLVELCHVASRALEGVLRQNRRDDGLWHSYNILDIDSEGGTMSLRNLQLMLEGQVAILSSGLLDGREAVALLEKMETSELRSRRHPTYLLYPDRELPRFADVNRIDESAMKQIGLLAKMIEADDRRLVYRDETGAWRFSDTLVNAYALGDCLDQIEELSQEDRRQIEDLYEEVFSHQSFTGRSGSMFGYEGLGCVYWHMVSKLMLAAQEVSLQVLGSDVDSSLKQRAISAYYQIQRGLGFRQSPKQYGAFPAEPYSHSQGERGAQQPGLTGQVKEGILCRLGELGVGFEGGCLCFRPALLRAAEFSEGTISFTQARTPVTYQLEEGGDGAVTVCMSDGSQRNFFDGKLDASTSHQALFEEGRVRNIIVGVSPDRLVS